MAMSKKARSEAAKKAARTRKRNAAKKPVRRRRRKPAKKGFLNDITGPEGRNTARAQFSGGIGGLGYLIYEDQVDLGTNATPEKKGLIAAIGAFGVGVFFKKPNVAAGITGAAAYDFFKEKGLLNDASWTQSKRMQYADPLQNLPVSLNDDQMYLAASGRMSLADSFDLADGMHDAWNTYEPAYAQSFSYM